MNKKYGRSATVVSRIKGSYPYKQYFIGGSYDREEYLPDMEWYASITYWSNGYQSTLGIAMEGTPETTSKT